MNNIHNYGDFLLEKNLSGDLPLVLSPELKDILSDMKHSIAKDLLDKASDINSTTPVTLIDIDKKSSSRFIISNSNKVNTYLNQNLNDYNISDKGKVMWFTNSGTDMTNPLWDKYRSSASIGKVINKIFGKDTYKISGDKDNDIESFIHDYKAKIEKGTESFKLVSGDDIIKYYNINNYDSGSGSELHKSCMAGEEHQPFIKFYSINSHKVNLLIMISPNDSSKIVGRALVWDIDEIDGKESTRKFMDRIYTIDKYHQNTFIDYANSNNWLYKEYQNSENITKIIDPSTGKSDIKILKVYGINEADTYPHLDTMPYYNTDDLSLTNDISGVYNYTLSSIEGGYTDNEYNIDYKYIASKDELFSTSDLINVDEVNDNGTRGVYYHVDDTFLSKYNGEYISKKMVDDGLFIYSELENDYIPEEDIVEVSNVGKVSNEYAEDNYKLCTYNDIWYKEEDVIESDKYDYVPKDMSVKVLTSFDDSSGKEEYDNRIKDDGSYIDKNGQLIDSEFNI